ncbi:MAG: hypothetical protein KF770_32040 [Anaerolineae bacterium]|nr:hypothetical protein [Anaerolineae bacterium]
MSRKSIIRQTGWIGSLLMLAAFLLFQPGTTAVHADGVISGIAFRDYNANGVQDTYEPGIGGVVVTAVNENNVSVTTTTALNGSYALPLLTGNAARVEFTLPTNGSLDFLRPGAAGGTTVQFVDISGGNVPNVNVGFNNPAQYSQPVPTVVSSVFVNGDPLAGGTAGQSKAFVSYPYDASGAVTPPDVVALASQVGSVWGTAPHSLTQTFFTAAMMKRHVGFGPLGPGGIYKLELPNTVTQFIDVNTIGINTGPTIPRTLGAVANAPTHDPDAFDAVGKVSIGDMDMSEDDQTLWLVNLFDRTLYSIHIGYSPTTPTASDVKAYPIPNPGCSNGDYRPWAVDTYDGKVYVGVVCSAETSQAIADLAAHVLVIDADEAPPGTFTTVFSMSLNYPRGYISTNGLLSPSAAWLPWIDQWTDIGPPLMPPPGQGPWGQVMYPQPMLTDIAFDIDGSMLLGFTDRFGHQGGNENYSTILTDTDTYEGAMGGDLIRVCNNAGTFVLENNAACPGGTPTSGAGNNQGPGGGEYYWQDMYNISTDVGSGTHQETIAGSLAHKFGSNEIITAVFDPVNTNRWRSGGVAWFTNSNGARPRGYELIGPDEGGQPATFGKVAGIGDVELLTAPAPLEVGNRVWQDDNGNGIQDPGEPPIAGVEVALVDSTGAVVATATTNANGLYYFTSLQYRVGYQLRINLAQGTLNGMSVSPPQADSTAFGEIRDSDGQPRLGGYVAIDFITGGPGENNHAFDFGFAPLVSLGDFVWDDQDRDGFYDGPVQVGDFVWYDLNGNGVQNAGEPGVNGVGVALHRSTDADCATLPLATTTTGPDGRYLFTDLPPGNYFVCFTLADLPAGFVVTVAGGDNAADATGRTGNTGPLAAGQQNLTRDMGIVNTAGLVTVGDKVWYDLNANGRQDPNEPGVPGVTVRLFTLGQICTDTPVASQTTDENGLYLFTGLADGNYFVCFDLTTIPAGYSLTAANNQLDDSVDSDADANGQTPPTGPLTTGQFDYTLDMGIVSAGNVSVGDRVWYDDNGNGLQDAGEGGVPGIGVALHSAADTDCADTPLVVTTTGGDGSYLFSGLPSSSYFVCFDVNNLPGGFEVTSQNVGGDDTIDSDADPTTGATAVTGIIPVNGSDLTLDMGIRQTDPGSVSVGDRVWYDDNRNGVQDPGEMGVPGVAVDLHPATNTDCADTPDDTTTTNNQGNYLFAGLNPGDYFVCFDLTTIPTGYVVTLPDQGGDDGADSDADPTSGQTPSTGALPAGQSNMTLDMGIYAPTHELLISGVTVQLYAAATICDGTSYIAQVTTDANGNYLFTGLPGGQYYVHIPASNFTSGGPLEYKFATLLTDPNPDDNQNNDNSAAEVTAGACDGGLSTNLVTLAITTEPLNDGRTDPNTPDNSHNLTVDLAAYEPVCIGDQVWYDADDSGTLNGAEYGINGIRVELYLDDGDGIFEPGVDDTFVDFQTTSMVGGRNGSYSFCDLIPRDYFVHIPTTQFAPGLPLHQTRSSTAVVDPAVTIAEDDNNGTDGGDAAGNGIVVLTSVTLTRQQEPTFDRNINDNGRRDSNTNQTIDFGITLSAPMDFGDLPVTYNNTVFGDDGPRHPNTGLFLGTEWDADNDGQESPTTVGDDNDNPINDEDGINFLTGAGSWGDGTGEVQVTVSGGSGCVLGWADYNADEDFADNVSDGVGSVSELLFAQLLNTGTFTVTFDTPQSSISGGTFTYPATLNMRFRIFPANDPLFAARNITLDAGCPNPAANSTEDMARISTGAASGGEVEDYQQQFSPTAVSLQNIQATMRSTPLLLLVLGAVALALTGLGIALTRRRQT